MKILLISPLPPPAGGIATWTNLYLESEQAKLNEVDIVNTAVFGSRVNNYNKRNFFDEVKRTVRILNDTETFVKSKCYDIVHINTSCSSLGMFRDYFCIKKSKNTRTKTIIHFHCDTSYMVKSKLSRFIFKKICSEGTEIFCLNTDSQNHIKGLSNKDSTIIPNFIENEITKKNNNKISEKIQNIIYVGHITKAKGCDDIIALAKKIPTINFKLIGHLSKEIQDIEVSDNVEFLGEIVREEVLNMMMRSDLLIFPSHTEGFPNTVLEAMTCGLPIIATPVGAIPDMIEDKGGILVSIGNIKEMSEAIKTLQDPEVRKYIGSWNQKKVETSYTANNVIEQIFEKYSNY